MIALSELRIFSKGVEIIMHMNERVGEDIMQYLHASPPK